MYYFDSPKQQKSEVSNYSLRHTQKHEVSVLRCIKKFQEDSPSHC